MRFVKFVVSPPDDCVCDSSVKACLTFRRACFQSVDTLLWRLARRNKAALFETTEISDWTFWLRFGYNGVWFSLLRYKWWKIAVFYDEYDDYIFV